MTSTFLTALLTFLSSHAAGILAGVVGARLSAWIAAHLKTQTEQVLYTDLLLPLFQSLSMLLQNVPAATTAAVSSAPTVAVVATGVQPAKASPPVYND